MIYVILGAAVALVVGNMWLTERRETRWHRTMQDLLNRKMARDFYDYVYGTNAIKETENPQMKLFKDIEQQIKDRDEKGRVKPFINDGSGVPSQLLGGKSY